MIISLIAYHLEKHTSPVNEWQTGGYSMLGEGGV